MKIDKNKWIGYLSLLIFVVNFILPLPIHAEITPPTNVSITTDVTRIAEAKNLAQGSSVTIEGTVTTVIGNNAFIQDETGGIYLYAGKNSNEYLSTGNLIRVQGELGEYNNLTQIKNISDVTLIAESNEPIVGKKVTLDQLDETLEASLVTAENVTIQNITSSYNDYNIAITDSDGNQGTIRISGYLNPSIDISQYLPGDVIHVTGSLGQYKNNYQIMVGTQSDIVTVSKSTYQPPAVKIPAIQGTGHRSPYENKDVKDVTGVVTAVVNTYYEKGFYMQDTESSNLDSGQSNGIFINMKNASSKVNVGDFVSVYGTVLESYAAPESMRQDNLTVTEIMARTVELIDHDRPLPEPVIIGEGGLIPPDSIEAGATQFYESIESMRVLIKKPIVSGVTEKYGEIAVLPELGSLEPNRTHTGGVRLTAEHYPTSRLIIDDVIVPLTNKQKHFIDPQFDIKVGDTFDGDIMAIASYGFGEFKFLNTEPLPQVIDGGHYRQPTSLTPDDDQLTIAEYNIENFSFATASPEKTKGLANSFVNDLKAPDIIALVEVQDDDGPEGNEGLVDASKSGQALIDAINDIAPELHYEYMDIPPLDNMDGGQPGANIRVGYLYNPDRVTLVDKGEKGLSNEEATLNEHGLTKNPMRLGTQSEAFSHTRKSLVAEFDFQGEKVFVITNHFSSKRGDGPVYGETWPPVKESEFSRHEQANLIHDFVEEIEKQVENANVVVVGDMNDYEFSDTIQILKGEGTLYNKVDDIPTNQRYNYVHAGISQVLDNALVSPNLKDHTLIDFVNINAEFTEHQGRTSDHDPVLLQIDIKNVPDDTPHRPQWPQYVQVPKFIQDYAYNFLTRLKLYYNQFIY